MLATARALVLDDRYDEVEPVIRALARLGIGSVYLNGDVEAMPETPLHGIRLAIIDMDLLGGDNGPAATAGHTLQVLEGILHGDANPLMVIVWTGSDEIYQEFAKSFPARFPLCAPGVVHRLDKAKFNLKNEVGIAEAAEEFRQTIIEQLAGARPLDLFWSWEQAVHDAASRTTSAIADIVQQGRAGEQNITWTVASSHVLAALARASAGQQGTSPEKLLDDLCSGLEPLLLDRLERHRVPDAGLVSGSADLIFQTAADQRASIVENAKYKKELGAIESFKERLTQIAWDTVDFIYSKGAPEADAGKKRGKIAGLVSSPTKPVVTSFAASQAARLNTMLHLSVLPGGGPVRPGNIYPVGAAGTEIQQLLSSLGLSEEQLRKDTFGSASKGGRAVLVEATPACDYAQGKWTMPSFVAGFLASEKDAGGLRAQAEFLRSYGPLWLEGNGGAGEVAYLVLNSHFAPSIGMEAVKQWVPILVLRRRTLTDLQVWLSSQHMRQGLLNVT